MMPKKPHFLKGLITSIGNKTLTVLVNDCGYFPNHYEFYSLLTQHFTAFSKDENNFFF